MAEAAESPGSRTRPETAHEAISDCVGWGKFPVTTAFFVEGDTPTTCVHETTRFRPFDPAEAASIAPTESSFASYAAALSKISKPATLNFSGLSLSFA